MVGISLLLATALPFSEMDYRIIADYDFDVLTNTTTRASSCTNVLFSAFDCFGGELLYTPAGTNGILQISATKQGYLTYAGDAVSPENTIFITMCRATNTALKAALAVGWIYQAATNNILTVTPGREMEPYEVPLSDVQPGSTLIIRPSDEVQRDRVFRIDRIIFARKRKHGFYIIIR